MPKGQRPRGVTPRRRTGAVAESTDCDGTGMAERSYPTPPRPRPGAAAGRTNPTSKEPWLHRHRRAERSYPTLKVRKGSGEEIPHAQGKRNPSKTVGVARGHQRADTLKP